MKPIRYFDLEKSEIIHTFEYYDFPLFFISKPPSNELFLHYYIEEVENDIDKWLFSRITSKELNNLIEQRISVLELLNSLLNKNRLYHLYVDSNLKEQNAELNLELVEDSNFDEESFPEVDFFVEYDYVTKQNLVNIELDLIDSSRFKMVLRDDRNSHDINLDLFLNVLSNLRETINDIAFDIGHKLMGQERTHEINLRVDSLQPSSFGIWLKTEPLDADLFEVPEKSLNNLFDLIEDIQTKNPNEIEDKIEIDEEYSLDTIKSVKDLLKDIADNDYSLSLEATTKTDKSLKEVKFDKGSYNKLDVLTNVLRKKNEKYTESVEVEGTLTSVNTTNNHFRISTSTGDFGGKMSKELFKRLKNDQNLKFKVPSQIKATIEKEIIRDYLEDVHSEKFILLHFEQPE